MDIIAAALLDARFPLIITANSGRNPRTVAPLSSLSKLLSIAIFTSCPSAVCVPYSHPYFLGSSADGKNVLLAEADVVIILDTDIPWIQVMGSKTRQDARVFVIDVDPLKQTLGWSHVDAELLCKADAEVALEQLIEAVQRAEKQNMLPCAIIDERGRRLETLHSTWMSSLDADEAAFTSDGKTPSVPYVLAALRKAVQTQTPSQGQKVLWLNEGISNASLIWNHLKPENPGSMLMSGGTSLGWALGAAIGAHMGGKVMNKGYELIAAVVGDGDFLFGAPSTSYWMASRYNTVGNIFLHHAHAN